MKKQLFKVEGFELKEKMVQEYPEQASRVLVPRGWKRVVIIKVE